MRSGINEESRNMYAPRRIDWLVWICRPFQSLSLYTLCHVNSVSLLLPNSIYPYHWYTESPMFVWALSSNMFHQPLFGSALSFRILSIFASVQWPLGECLMILCFLLVRASLLSIHHSLFRPSPSLSCPFHIQVKHVFFHTSFSFSSLPRFEWKNLVQFLRFKPFFTIFSNHFLPYFSFSTKNRPVFSDFLATFFFIMYLFIHMIFSRLLRLYSMEFKRKNEI